jgi:hypothetical protein
VLVTVTNRANGVKYKYDEPSLGCAKKAKSKSKGGNSQILWLRIDRLSVCVERLKRNVNRLTDVFRAPLTCTNRPSLDSLGRSDARIDDANNTSTHLTNKHHQALCISRDAQGRTIIQRDLKYDTAFD